VNAAARVGALANGDEILASAETASLAGTRPVSAPRSVTLKGFANPVDVVSVQWN
jgi:class 3 adenylate cyclase